MVNESDINQLSKLFFPSAHKRQDDVESNRIRFVHYTNADAAMNIIRTKTFWMRESSCQNDFMEITHGLNCLNEIWFGEYGNVFKSTLDNIFGGISNEIQNKFNEWFPHIQSETYLACFSEHDDSEDTFGRLSMWRAYSEITGVAVVMNTQPFFKKSNALKAYSTPVAYLKNFELEFKEITKNISSNTVLIKKFNREAIVNVVFRMLWFATISTKHPGFKEEREWRVVYSPSLEKSKHVDEKIVSVRGSPQRVYEIPLKDIPEDGFTGAEIRDVVDRIIIGPTQFPLAIWKAFVSLLTDAGVKNASERVVTSDIPLRR